MTTSVDRTVSSGLGCSLVTPILMAHEPEYGSKHEDGTRKSEQMLGIGCRQIDDHQLAHDGEQCDQDTVRTCTTLCRRSAITSSERLNSSAMMTVKIIPNSA